MLTDFNGDGAKKIQNGQLKKTDIFNSPQFSNFGENFLRIGGFEKVSFLEAAILFLIFFFFSISFF